MGRNVRVARKDLGWSQEDLAFETDIDRTYISGIERGVRNPSLDMLVKLAKTLKMTPANLLTK
jgi:transcriptional regulator with XRE-family HTH domain